MATAFGRLFQNMVRIAKTIAQNIQQNFGRNVGKTEKHILHLLLHGGTFALCANQLVKFTSVDSQKISSTHEQVSWLGTTK
jgi:hypothetical protein